MSLAGRFMFFSLLDVTSVLLLGMLVLLDQSPGLKNPWLVNTYGTCLCYICMCMFGVCVCFNVDY